MPVNFKNILWMFASSGEIQNLEETKRWSMYPGDMYQSNVYSIPANFS